MLFHLREKFNRGEKKVIFAIPQSNSYQQITDLHIQPQPNITLIDKWGNEIITLNDVVNFSLKFTYQEKFFAVNENKLKLFSLADYQKINQSTVFFYTRSNRFIHPGHPQIKKTVSKIVSQEKNLLKITKKLYKFTLNYLIYDNPIEGLYSDLESLNKKRVDCGGFSTLLISLLNSQNIPARLVVGFIIKKNFIYQFLSNLKIFSFDFKFLLMHAWVEVLLPDNSWFPVDPSIEWRRNHYLSKRQGGFGFIPADRLVISYGCDLRNTIEENGYQLDIIQKLKILK